MTRWWRPEIWSGLHGSEFERNKSRRMHTQREDEFARTPILENRVLLLTSRCRHCIFKCCNGRQIDENTYRHGTPTEHLLHPPITGALSVYYFRDSPSGSSLECVMHSAHPNEKRGKDVICDEETGVKGVTRAGDCACLNLGERSRALRTFTSPTRA